MFSRVLAALLAALALAPAAEAKKAPAPLRIQVVSNRADLISAGDALVAISYPERVDPARLGVTVAGRDVSDQFALRPNGRYEALLTDLPLGSSTLKATLPGRRGAQIEIDNHPNGGPVFSGPQVQPWQCQETAKDRQCNEPVEYEFEYMPSGGGSFRPYDPGNPPSDVAQTTTDQGRTVPFIIRTETGYQDRDQYKISVLYQPGTPWAAWDPQPQWNHKLLITHGASCGIEHKSGEAPSTTGDTIGIPGGPGLGNSPTEALGRGFAVMSTALDNSGHNCNIVTQAESLVMAKERLVEQYGEIRYTIGTGCSGGSLAQQQIANAYPGVYQGILPQCSFPDSWSTGQQLAAYNLLRRYLENPGAWGPGVTWDPISIGAVEGHPNHVNSIVFDSVYWTDLGVPDDGCAGVPPEQNYNAETNPGGVRCTLADYQINVFGPRPQSLWIAPEKKIGRGFAGIPLGDEGVQFGLIPLMKGQITPAQFVDLNAKVGGVDIDINHTPDRLRATEPALERAYRSGAINSTNNMKGLAIIDLRGPDPGAFHDAYRSWTIRARLEREEGHFPKNHVIWFGQAPLIGDPNWTTEGLLAMDRWLAKVEADKRKVSLEQKVAEDRPEDIQDRCSQIPGVEQIMVPGVGQVCSLEQVQTRYGTPAMAAGESVATDTNQCRLKPLRRADYYPIGFTDEQWQQLEKAFPTGVCDWSKPGVSQQRTIPWQTYQDSGGNVVYGGRPLGPPPRSHAVGKASKKHKKHHRKANRRRGARKHR
jgi:hypothetical protein